MDEEWEEKKAQHTKGRSAGGFNNQQYLIKFLKNALVYDLLKQERLHYLNCAYGHIKSSQSQSKDSDLDQETASTRRYTPNTASCNIQSRSHHHLVSF